MPNQFAGITADNQVSILILLIIGFALAAAVAYNFLQVIMIQLYNELIISNNDDVNDMNLDKDMDISRTAHETDSLL